MSAGEGEGPMVETMSVSVVSTTNGFHSEATPAGYGGKFVLVGAEPEDEGGSGKGPNPMQLTMASLIVCEHEESQVVAESVSADLGKSWKKCDWATEFDVNLSGFEGKAPNADTQPLKASDVFRKVFISAKAPSASGGKGEDLEALRKAIHATCPVTRLFDACGVAWEETITAGDSFATNKDEAHLKDELTFRMRVESASDGLHSDVTVKDDVEHKFALAEPEEDGGSGKGPNPMECLISGLAICEFEQSLVVAKERGVKQWEVEQELSFQVNLDGYMNKVQDMAAKDVFQKVTRKGTVKTEADAAAVASILEATANRCPVTRLFVDAGCAMEGQWTKA